MRARRGPAVAIGVAVAALILAQPAAASCAPDQRPLEDKIAEADVAFVGTAEEVRNDGRTAGFAVEEVWKGPELAPTVVVHGAESDDAAMVTSVDRYFTEGGRYLVVAAVREGRIVDNACSPTRPWEEDLARARPADVRSPDAEVSGTAAATAAPWVVGGVALAAVCAGGGWWLTRRRG